MGIVRKRVQIRTFKAAWIRGGSAPWAGVVVIGKKGLVTPVSSEKYKKSVSNHYILSLYILLFFYWFPKI